ncbi:MAG TPA: hypothetical protein VFA70_05960, partial [Dehalococcoidia bacterium]|nr:hypothetical protein [Dehalococcoidia bacterium]
MQRRGRRGWRRWAWGFAAAVVMLGALITGVAAAASVIPARSSTGGNPSDNCPLGICLPTPTPTVSVPPVKTPKPKRSPCLTCGLPSPSLCLNLNCLLSPSPSLSVPGGPTPTPP